MDQRVGKTLKDLQITAGVTDCLFTYARAVDRCDWAAVRECYTSDAVDYHGTYHGDVEGLIQDLRERHAHLDRSMHVITNIMVQAVSSTEAMVESYCLCYRRYRQKDEKRRQTLSTVRCRYLDHMISDADHVWKIASRIVVFDESRLDQICDDTPDAAAVSTRDGHDPLWEFLRGGPTRAAGHFTQSRTIN